jgi:pimeloyl-ACP methyl ester carboxylesterase
MVAALPNARFSRIPGAGHLVPLERPDAVAAELVQFLAEAAP